MFSFASKLRKSLVYIKAHCYVPSSLLSFMKDHDSLVSIEDIYCFIKKDQMLIFFHSKEMSRQVVSGFSFLKLVGAQGTTHLTYATCVITAPKNAPATC